MRYTKKEKIDLSLMERVNPVYHTARMTLLSLAAAGDRDAAALSERLDRDPPGNPGAPAFPAEDRLAALRDLANSVFLEIRFRTVGAMAEQSGCPTLVDLPCGYTPRGLQTARRNRSYIGLDLPAGIHEMERAVLPLAGAELRPMIRYAAVDATNYASLKTALEGTAGPVCITTEGLLMYLNAHETDALCGNIRRLLTQFGGCWITSDPEMMIQNTLVMRAIAGDRAQEIMNRLMRGFEKKADIHVEDPAMMILPWKNGGKDVARDTEKALSFLSGRGLMAQRLPVARYMPEIKSFSALRPEIGKAIRAGMEQCAYWKITPLAGEKSESADEAAAEGFSVRAARTGGILNLTLRGRVDTLTAPRVLALSEELSKDVPVTRVSVDCAGLRYISSAGLRVLLILRKKHPVRLKAVNAAVREILQNTGFDSILEVEEAADSGEKEREV